MNWLTDRLDLFGDPSWHVTVLGLDLQGRGLYLALLASSLLLLTAPVALKLGGEIRTRWQTWAMILPVVGIPLWTGRIATTILATLLAAGASLEYARVAKLARADTVWLLGCAVVMPLATLSSRGFPIAGWVPWAILGGAAIPLLGADHVDGFRRAAMTSFGIVWLCWSLANLPLLGRDAFVVLFAAACADVGAFVGGTSLKRFAWGRAGLTPLSPNKTWGGVAGGFVAATLILLACDSFSIGWLLAVWIGGIAGDLLESMLKRQQSVKDAGDWLPGFGGLLDRIDSLLIAMPLAVLLA
ncbi:phosphatidate cytidylyltransferase [Kineosporia succinea]|uniref:Phosphatidate cytidylyltransferase n=1 Tax=Kineosporia succinea TaxID=84632 RepID=A0ABT9P963_9ACTN|nr:phosphatidate cytidylyltransferase [Kineosporia succinea]MDP9829239.1 phosphatidate cytidylyltransferase [Kineosporia succinea]